MSKKYFHRKLIRDKIPQIMKAFGSEFEIRIMDSEEFEKELKKKLQEEAKEVAKAENKEIINELADVLEIIKSISFQNSINFKDVQKLQAEKRKKSGGFNKKLFLVWSSIQSGK